jgi:hypothetical protein
VFADQFAPAPHRTIAKSQQYTGPGRTAGGLLRLIRLILRHAHAPFADIIGT